VPLLATLLAWGHDGIAKRLDQTMALADDLAARLAADPRVELWRQPETAVILWRPMNGQSVDALRQQFPAGMSSATTVDGHLWVRHVAANPNADIEVIWAAIDTALG
jgi:glutamate/tyrosine decarboxylase-like PLP-dependent enzyme